MSIERCVRCELKVDTDFNEMHYDLDGEIDGAVCTDCLTKDERIKRLGDEQVQCVVCRKWYKNSELDDSYWCDTCNDRNEDR